MCLYGIAGLFFVEKEQDAWSISAHQQGRKTRLPDDMQQCNVTTGLFPVLNGVRPRWGI